MLKVLKPLTLAAVATLALTGAAEAAGIKNASFELQSSVFNHPLTLVFAPKDGKYELKEIEGGSIQARLQADKIGRGWIASYHINLHSRNGQTLVSSGWEDLKAKKVDKSFTFKLTKDLLKPQVAEGRKFCNENGNPLKKVVKKRSLGIYATVKAGMKDVTLAVGKSVVYINRGMNYSIACMPAHFEVNDVQLSVKYEGNSRDCPVKATLQAKFKTNKPEKQQFTFVLVRDNGMKQEVTRYAYPQGNGGVASWQKSYTFTKTESRKYMIYVKGHKATAMWVPVGANCSSSPAGGFSNGPIPTN